MHDHGKRIALILFGLALCLLLACAASAEDVPPDQVHLLDNTTLELAGSEGLTFPIPSGEGWYSAEVPGCAYYLEKTDGDYLYQYKVSNPYKYSFAISNSSVESYYQRQTYNFLVSGGSGLYDFTTQLEGYPVGLTSVASEMETRGTGIRSTIHYARGVWEWTITASIYPQSLNHPVASLSPDLSDIRTLASMITYDEEHSDVGLSILIKDNPTRLTAGKSLSFKAEFADTDLVSSKNKNNTIEWSVTDSHGAPVEGISISKSGNLSTSKKLDHNVDIIVQVRSESFMTRAYYPLQVIPVVTGIRADPEEIIFYLGSSGPAEIHASITPECVPADVLSWKSSAPKFAEVTDRGNGIAVVEPLSLGKTSVTVSESGGKKATVSIVVAQEVTDLALSYKGKTAPGSGGTVSADLLPKNATIRDLTWSLNVGEDVATINRNGQLKINKTAPAGTVITVTCTAAGASVPLARTLDITVTE